MRTHLNPSRESGEGPLATLGSNSIGGRGEVQPLELIRISSHTRVKIMTSLGQRLWGRGVEPLGGSGVWGVGIF